MEEIDSKFASIAERIHTYFLNKHSLKISSVEFSHSYSFSSGLPGAEKKYIIQYIFDWSSKLAMNLGMSNRFESTQSFDHAFEKSKLVIKAYDEADKLDEE